MRIKSNSNSVDLIETLTPFKGNSMSASGPTYYTGRLPRGWAELYMTTLTDIDYVVYSWATPIAWHYNSGIWVYPNVSYSGYTSRHQSFALMGVRRNVNGDYKRWIMGDRYVTVGEAREALKRTLNGDYGYLPFDRRAAYVTVRGIRNGDYLWNDVQGRYTVVHGKERIRGVHGTYYWRAESWNGGARDLIYIGDATERVTRLR